MIAVNVKHASCYMLSLYISLKPQTTPGDRYYYYYQQLTQFNRIWMAMPGFHFRQMKLGAHNFNQHLTQPL